MNAVAQTIAHELQNTDDIFVTAAKIGTFIAQMGHNQGYSAESIAIDLRLHLNRTDDNGNKA